MPEETCCCLELRIFLNRNKFRGHGENHQERCVLCVNQILDAKNDLVRENGRLLEEASRSKLTGVEGTGG